MDQIATRQTIDESVDDTYNDADFVEDRRGIDLAALFIAARRNLSIIIAVVLSAVLLALVATALTAPKYTATASVQIEQQASQVLEEDVLDPAISPLDAERHLTTQIDILKSRGMAERVAQSLRLFDSDQFFAEMGTRPPTVVAGGPPAKAQLREAVLNILQENLEVRLPEDSRVARVDFTSPDRNLAARVANAFVENLITSNLQRRYDSSSYARDFLRTQLNDARAQLETSERQLNEYARRAGLIHTGNAAASTANDTIPGSITTASLVQLNEALNAAERERIEAEQRWRAARNASLLSLPEVTGNPAIQVLLQQRAEQEAALSEARQRHREEHPSIRASTARVAEINDQIARIAGNIRQGIEQRYRVSAGQENSLSTRVDNLKTATLAEQDRSVRYNILRRGVDTNRALYDGLLQRFREVSTAAGVTTNNISIVDRADPPLDPSSPNLLFNLALSFAGGCALAFFLVFAREQMDDRVRTSDDVERKLGITSLGAIPLAPKSADVNALLSDPLSPVAEAYAALRTALLFSTGTGLPGSLAVTSSQPGEGKSTTAIAVARMLGASGKSVLLIDADLRRPSVHRTLGLSNNTGLTNVLVGDSPIEIAIRESGYKNLSVMTSGPLPPNPAELLSHDKLQNLFEAASTQFACVIIDSPPVLGLADAPIIAAAADATVFVLEANRNHHGRAKAAIRRLRMTQSYLIGVVLTKFDAGKAGIGGYYGYDYYRYSRDDHGPQERDN